MERKDPHVLEMLVKDIEKTVGESPGLQNATEEKKGQGLTEGR